MKKLFLFAICMMPLMASASVCESANMVVAADDNRQVMNAADSAAFDKSVAKINALVEEQKKLRTEARALYQANGQLTKAQEDDFNARWSKIVEAIEAGVIAEISANMETPVAGELMGKYAPMAMSNTEGEVAKQLPVLMANYKGFDENPGLKAAKSTFEKMTRKNVGSMFVDVTQESLTGGKMSLSDYVGKGSYVLVDFWASWCGPCRAEMPNVVAAYAEYHSKGFEIVGVSLDNDHAKWAESVKTLGITWPQMSDLQGWKSSAADVYGIRSIPSTILFGPDGRVVAADLRGDELQHKLAEIYGE